MLCDRFWFGFRHIVPSPPGNWVLQGFPTKEEAEQEQNRENGNYDCEVTMVFEAESEELAANKLNSLTSK